MIYLEFGACNLLYLDNILTGYTLCRLILTCCAASAMPPLDDLGASCDPVNSNFYETVKNGIQADLFWHVNLMMKGPIFNGKNTIYY